MRRRRKDVACMASMGFMLGLDRGPESPSDEKWISVEKVMYATTEGLA